jgi:cell wall assembly regulator SMI1
MFSEPTGPIKSSWFDRGWVPVADNGNGDHHCLDFSPEEGGEVGQVIFWWHEAGATEVVGPTFVDWFNNIGDGLASGRYEIRT